MNHAYSRRCQVRSHVHQKELCKQILVSFVYRHWASQSCVSKAIWYNMVEFALLSVILLPKHPFTASLAKMKSPYTQFAIWLMALQISPAYAYWRMACSVSQTSRIDPILNPGTVSGHVHKFAGGNSELFGLFHTLT